MGAYFVKRLLYSVWILVGILIVTFLLFRVAAGDPTAVLLGKNPMPLEIESLRDSLGCDKPLFFGFWRTTELYAKADFRGGRSNFPGVRFGGAPSPGEDGLVLKRGDSILFQRAFPCKEKEIRIKLDAAGAAQIAGRLVRDGEIVLSGEDVPEELAIAPADESGVIVRSVVFQRPTKSAFDSQALDSLKELVAFTDSFPYVSFFNFGRTLQTREPIRAKLWEGMWPSIMLMIPIFLGELFFGVALAMIACAWRNTWLDRGVAILSIAGMSISYLVLIILGQWFLAYRLNWFPVWGWGSPRCLALPVLIGIVSGTGSGVRFYRTVFMDEIRKEYLRTAAAKGARPARIYCVHLLKNAMVPIITRAATVLPFLFTGSLLLESFFGIPGLGFAGINALNDSDLGMLKALVLLSAILFIFINLLTDLAYAWVDPRVRADREN